jgi:hypothetical protein
MGLQVIFLCGKPGPQRDEMESASNFLGKLEGLPYIERDVIHATEIDKALRKISILEGIPDEAKFQIKSRSERLLERWNMKLEHGEPSIDDTVEASQNNDWRNSQVIDLISDDEEADTRVAEHADLIGDDDEANTTLAERPVEAFTATTSE